MRYPIIEAFDPTDAPLTHKAFPNGGWVVYQGSPEPGMLGKELGAFGSAQEMLDALKCLAE